MNWLFAVTIRSIIHVAPVLFVSCLSIPSPGQALWIAWPGEGTVVPSGQILTVRVEVNSSEIQSVGVYSLAKKGGGIPPLTHAPYEFRLPIDAEAPSGPYGVTAIGSLRGTDRREFAFINIDVERADLPKRLTGDVERLVFHYLGEDYPLDIEGGVGDGSRVVLNHSKLMTYLSEQPAVATVDWRGVVTAVAPGEAFIMIKYGNETVGTLSAHLRVLVPDPIHVSPATATIHPSEEGSFSAAVFLDPNVDQSVIWSISPQIGSIDQSGLYRAPSFVSSRQRITVTATSVADPSKRASAALLIEPHAGKK